MAQNLKGVGYASVVLLDLFVKLLKKMLGISAPSTPQTQKSMRRESAKGKFSQPVIYYSVLRGLVKLIEKSIVTAEEVGTNYQGVQSGSFKPGVLHYESES
ncbi:uncharacterized protein LOC113281482 isoform X2 [Papaver somniferum]|uniref:uncharacterized protein LOC113281482 isoform X2 n=1 Tax=Papaver somniferum TaxID=3469 RepID=UPI000E6F647E|nr:uncharacterized protein LOC113281482 isoform X2 [Papaver somniferum]XP_026386031.1 uncharacterized protein LOC113281482 isoform X2 [Papaver somniferum]